MLVASLVTHCCATAFHSLTSVVASQPPWLCRWVTLNSTLKLSPHKCSVVLRAGHFIHSVGVIVVISVDGVWSQTVEDMGLPLVAVVGWSLISISLCFEMTSNDDKSCFSSDGDATPHHHTTSTKRCYSVGAAISIALYILPPHFDPAMQLSLDSSPNTTFLQMFRLQGRCCRHKRNRNSRISNEDLSPFSGAQPRYFALLFAPQRMCLASVPLF